MSTKPLIFIYPLSETMKKLKEAIEEISESEAVEIYEVDELSEIAQLVPTIGQSLSIYGAPKKCAMSLKQLKKVNAKLNSKVLLINEKAIPRKTLDKFSKIGLTEFIQEPVAAKTLLYKVKLQLKSIVTGEDDDDDEEVGVKSSEGHADAEAESDYRKSRKDSTSEEEELNYLTGKRKKRDYETEEVEEKKKKKSNYSEEAIDSNWAGKTKKEDDEEHQEEPSKHEQETESIDGYLRGKEKVEEEIEEEEEKKRNHYKDEIISKNLSGKIKQTTTEEEEEPETKTSEDILDIKEINKDISKEINSDLSHYKGSISTETEEEEEEERKKKSNLTLIDSEDEKDFIDQDEDEEELKKKKRENLSIEEAEESEITQKAIEEDEEETKAAKKSDLEIDSDKEASEGTVEHLESEETSGEGSTDKIDGYLRGGAAKRDEEEEDERSKKDLTSSLDIEDSSNESDLEIDQENEDDDKEDYKNKAELNIEESKKDSKEDSNNEADDESDYLNKKKNTELEFEPEGKELQKKDEVDDKEYEDRKGAKAPEVDEKERTRSNSEAEEEKKRKTHESQTDDLTKEQMKANSKVDKIQTHYSSDASVSHIDDDWSFGKSDKKTPEEDTLKKDDSEHMSYGEKVDLGEQTIDYSKLKDEFGGITVDREANKVKKTGPKYYGGGPGQKAKTPSYYRDEDSAEEASLETEQEEENGSENQIFEPASKGLENIVRVLNFYSIDKDAEMQAYQYVSKVIQSNFNGEVALFYYDEKKARVNEATNSLNTLGPLELELKKPIWDKLFSKNYRSWKDIKLPTWTDETFQEKDIQFIYPYFEGTSLMGFAVTWFTAEFNQEKCKELEVTLETLRGFLISNFRKNLQAGEYNGQEKKEETTRTNPIKSFFGNLFKRKAS